MILSIISFTLNAVIGFIEFVVGLRFALKVIGAGTQAPFVAWVYRTSDPFIASFRGVFPNFKLGFIEIEPASILAFVVYGVIGLVVNQVLSYTKQESRKEDRR